jgi:hypothetical protein
MEGEFELRNIVSNKKKKRTMTNVQKLNNCIFRFELERPRFEMSTWRPAILNETIFLSPSKQFSGNVPHISPIGLFSYQSKFIIY